MGITIRDVGSSHRQPLAPNGKVDAVDFSKLDVDSPLSNAGPAHAWKIRLAADLQREAAVHDVIPTIPFRHTGRVHGANEIAKSLRNRDEDFLSADAVQLGNGQVR